MPKIALTDLAIQRLKAEDGQVRYFDQSTPGFGLLVGKRAKTFFVITGKERRMTTLGAYGEISLKDARAEARRILANPTTPKAAKTYAQAVDAYLKERKPHLTHETYRHYKRYLDNFAFTGNLADINKLDIKKGVAQWEGHRRGQNNFFAALRTFLNWCVEQEIITHHPINHARLPNRAISRDRVLTDEELAAIWKHTDHAPYGNLIRLLMLTGARKMEIRHLVVEGDYITFKATKNKTDHSLPITPLIRAHLLPQPYTFDNWEREKIKLDKRSGVTNWVVHDLRRSAATNLIRLGVRSDVVEQAILNHKRQGIAAVYQRWKFVEEAREALLTLEAHIVKITTARVQPEPSTAPYGVGDDHTDRKEAPERSNQPQPTTLGET